MRRKPNVEQRRRDLCDAAIELLAEDGARGLTHLRVDRRAGVVDDLDATMDWFTKVAGYRWTDVVEVEQQGVTPGGEVTIPMRMVFSADPPRLEFLQTVPGTIWVPADSGVHHVGYWSDDVEADLAMLESNGMRYEVKSYNPDGSGKLLWAYTKGPTGPRIELVSRAMEPFIEYWWSTAA